MNKALFSNKKNIINLKKIFFVLVVFSILLRIPKVFSLGMIYGITYSTRLIGNYSVDYVLTIFDVAIILIGILFYFKSRNLNLVPLVSFLLIYNVYRWFLGSSNIFDLNSFEIVFSFLIVLSCGNIILYYFHTPKQIMFILKILILLLFITQIIYFVTGRSGTGDKDYGVGYGGLGINSGALGLVYSLFGLTLLCSTAKKYEKTLYLLIVLIGLFLTGSRTNLILFLSFLLIFFIFFSKIKSKILFLPILFFSFVIFLNLGPSLFSSNVKLASLFELLNGDVFNNVLSNISVQERLESWSVAFSIIKDNPFGLSSSASDLIERMFSYGAVTFPHSYLLCYYLLFGFGSLVIYFCFLRETFFSMRRKSRLSIPLLFCITIFTVYGGISTDYILFFVFYLFIVLVFKANRQSLNKKQNQLTFFR